MRIGKGWAGSYRGGDVNELLKASLAWCIRERRDLCILFCSVVLFRVSSHTCFNVLYYKFLCARIRGASGESLLPPFKIKAKHSQSCEMIFILKANAQLWASTYIACSLAALNLLCTLEQHKAPLRALQGQLPDIPSPTRESTVGSEPAPAPSLPSARKGGGSKREVAETSVQPSQPQSYFRPWGLVFLTILNQPSYGLKDNQV